MLREAGWEPETGRVKPGCLGVAAMMGWPRRCRWAQPWTLLLLLLGPQLLVTHGWRPQGNENSEDRNILELYFPAVVEYALHMYNLRSQDSNAYKVKEKDGLVFSTELQFARTRCGKFDEDIDNCPFQATPDVNNTVTCFFTVDSEPWRTEFRLLNNTCLEGSAE
ncbi:cystatin-9-like isoform X2 [Moschus berezovskii]|uniref:cystatin-9-like isoform X2 n=1 Tax=Moschus berezovskii TaxID=68408 RepID=UPI0024448911|nr:cystatin-9-like isoform X2 [Moschus berezovskii]